MSEDVLIRLRLIGDDARRLRALAGREMRRPTEQAKYLICEAIMRESLEPETESARGETEAVHDER